MTILGFGLLVGPVNQNFYWFFVRDPLWLMRDPFGWKEHFKVAVRNVIIQGIFGLGLLIVGIIGLLV